MHFKVFFFLNFFITLQISADIQLSTVSASHLLWKISFNAKHEIRNTCVSFDKTNIIWLWTKLNQLPTVFRLQASWRNWKGSYSEGKKLHAAISGWLSRLLNLQSEPLWCWLCRLKQTHSLRRKGSLLLHGRHPPHQPQSPNPLPCNRMELKQR